MQKLRPLLAAQTEDADLSKLTFPMFVSPKLDGIRVLLTPEGPRTRSLKPVPNKYISYILSNIQLQFLDGEIIVGEPTDPHVFNKTTSGVMSRDGQPNFTFYAFDHYLHCGMAFDDRLRNTRSVISDWKEDCGNDAKMRNMVEYLPHDIVHNLDDLMRFEEQYVSMGYEGLMARRAFGVYKFGRSTFREQILLKFKRYMDAEAIVIGIKPLLRNNNPAEFDALGLQKRSSHKANKIPDELMGKLVVKTPEGTTFEIGSGFDVDTRIMIWNNQSQYLGKQVVYKFQEHGTLNKPRQPIFKAFRGVE